MKSIKVLMAALMMVAFSFASCSKDDEDKGVAEGKMTSTIDGKSIDFTVSGVLTTAKDDGKTYQNLIITGGSGTSASDAIGFLVTVNAEKIEAKKYEIPTYTKTYEYNYLTGFAMGAYTKTATQENYYSFGYEKATGSVTITSISSTSVKGSYDMVLTNISDITKTMTLKGEFNCKVTAYNYGTK